MKQRNTAGRRGASKPRAAARPTSYEMRAAVLRYTKAENTLIDLVRQFLPVGMTVHWDHGEKVRSGVIQSISSGYSYSNMDVFVESYSGKCYRVSAYRILRRWDIV